MESNEVINTGVSTPENSSMTSHAEREVQPDNAGRIKINATQEVYQELQHVYDYYNTELFNGELPGALLVITRKRNSKGFYSPARYANKEGQLADEIAMNPEFFLVRSVEEVLSTLAHEMTHQWQFHFGIDVRAGYHNKEFSVKMESIGMITSATGYPGGDRVGERMTHYIAEDGLFIKVTRELLKTRFGILWYDRYPNQYLLRPPSKQDVENAEQHKTELEEEHKKALEEQGKALSNRGRKKQEILKVEPAAVSSPAITIDTPLTQAVNTEVVNQEPSMANVTNVVAKLIKRQEAKMKAGKRVKYTCPSCQDSAWGKSDMTLICGREGCSYAKMGIEEKSAQKTDLDLEMENDLLN
jgi:predicted SprT family Zn-dependent metalloprotease